MAVIIIFSYLRTSQFMFHVKRSYQESPGGNECMKVLSLEREQRNNVAFIQVRCFGTHV